MDLQNTKENRDMMRDLGKDLEKENRLMKLSLEKIEAQNSKLENELRESRNREESAKMSLKNSQLSSQSMGKEKEQKFQKAVGTVKYIRKESYEMAKKLKKLKPDWRPNTQNDKIFLKEVLNELWNRLELLNAEKQRRDQESLMFMTNKNFLQDQVGALGGNQQGSKQIIKQSLETRKNFEGAMHILDDIVTNIEEANSNFDDCVIDAQDKRVDGGKVFDHLVTFFDRVEKIKDADGYRKLMDIYYS